MSSPVACGRDTVAVVALPWAASEVASRGARGVAWRGTWRPAKAVMEAAEPLRNARRQRGGSRAKPDGGRAR